MKLYFENIITDLRKNGIKITREMFDAINEFVDMFYMSLVIICGLHKEKHLFPYCK